MVYEYRIVDLPNITRIDKSRMERELNALAKEGWHVHTAVNDYILMERITHKEEPSES